MRSMGRSAEMKNLIGKKCRCVFSLLPRDWPFEGYPAWVIVDEVDMPMVLMRSAHGGTVGRWVNAGIIETIEAAV